MNLVSPERFIWLLAAVPIVVFYILRTRQRRQPVPTLVFWDQLFDEKRQRSLWQQLRHLLSLLIQLAFLALIVAALVDPLWKGQDDAAHQVVIVLDNSASMQASEPGEPTRFSLAQQRATETVNALRDGDQVALITAGGSVRVVVGMTDFRPVVRDAIQDAAVTDGPTRIGEAVALARTISGDSNQQDIVVVTDSSFELDSDSESDFDDVRFIAVGQSLDNVAVTAFSIRRSFVDPIGYAAMIEVRNFGEQAVEGRLTLDLEDDLVDVFPLELEPQGIWRKTVDGASAKGGVLRARLDIQDGLSVDNTAMAILPERPRVPVVLVSESPNLYLESVLNAIPLIDLTTSATPPEKAPPGGFLVMHRVVANQTPAGQAFYIDPREDCELWRVGDEVGQPIVADQNLTSPLMPHVQLQNVMIPGARRLEPAEDAEVLLSAADGSTLMASLSKGDDRTVVLSADLDASDLPLRIAFPVMMTNAVNWFLGRTGELEPPLQTGTVAKVAVNRRGDRDWSWVDSAGHRSLATTDEETVTVGPVQRVGLARVGPTDSIATLGDPDAVDPDAVDPDAIDQRPTVDTPSAVKRLAVNLCDPAESDLKQRFEVDSQDQRLETDGLRSPWFYLTCLAFGLTVGEWVLYQRRYVS